MSGALDFRAIHELSHAARAEFEGFRVPSVRIGNCGGEAAVLFPVDADPRAVGRVLVAGSVGEEVFLGVANPWHSIVDSTRAYACAFEVARDEEHGSGPVASARDRSEKLTAAEIGQKVAELPAAAVVAGIARVTSRRTRRAGEIVNEWREEVREWVRANLCVIRAPYAALVGRESLDETQLAALLQEGRERQEKDDTRFGAASGGER